MWTGAGRGACGLIQKRSSLAVHIGSSGWCFVRSDFGVGFVDCLFDVHRSAFPSFVHCRFLFLFFASIPLVFTLDLPPQDRTEKLKHCIIWSFHGLLQP